MPKKNKTQRRHDGLVSRLEDFLVARNDDLMLYKFLEYNQSDRFVADIIQGGDFREVTNPMGELDLLVFRGGIWQYYEVKCSYTNKSRNKALRQYSRFRTQFNKDRTEGFIYCGEAPIRL